MAQNLIKTNAEAVLPNRPTIVKYIAGLEGGAELIYRGSEEAPEDGVFHAGHPVAMHRVRNKCDGWELAPIVNNYYTDFDDSSDACGFGVLAHDVPVPAVSSDGNYYLTGAIMLIGVVNTDADVRFEDTRIRDNFNSGVVFYGANLAIE